MMACDSHLHFYSSRFPTSASASIKPPDATVADYFLAQAALGVDRLVAVQPTTYGLDNSCQLEAIKQIGASARGVVVVEGGVSDTELRTMTELGIRGARFHMLPGGAVGWDQIEPVAKKIAPFGWHIQIQLNGHSLPARREQLLNLPCPIVIDHVGRFMPPVDPSSPPFRVLIDLVDAGAHVKLSAPYESALDDSHSYDQVSECVEALVSHAPDRLLWASNWPHPGQVDPPTNADLVRLRERWLADAAVRQQVMVSNPAKLYDF